MKKVFPFFLIFFCFNFLFSCSNFEKGSELVKEIEEQISINTAPSITVRLGSLPGTGTFPSARDISVKVGKSFSVEFILNHVDYTFKEWVFTDVQTETARNEENIKFEASISGNIYTVDVTVLKQIDNLLIKPECILIPKAVKQLPEMIEEGKPQDSTIVVVFNTPVNAEDFDGTFKNISIKSGGVEIAEEYFNPPVLSSDKKNLSIIPVGSKKLIENVTENGTRDITVTLKTGKVVDLNGNVVREPLLNENGDCPFYNDISWTYRVNQNQDGEAPVIHSVSLFADAEEKRGISTDDYTTWTTKRDENGKNDFDRHHVRELFVKINGSDVGGGIRCVKVSELLVKNQSGTAVNPEEKISYFKDGSFENEVLIPFSFVNLTDGLVKLDFSLIDYAGNESECYTYYVIKDTTFESSFIYAVLINNSTTFDTNFGTSSSSTPVYREADENGIDTVQIDCSNTFKRFFETKECFVNVYVESSYDGINYSDENITKNSPFLFTLKREAKLNTYVRISCEDDVGNKTNVVRVIPKSITILEKPWINTSNSDYDRIVFTATNLRDLYGMGPSIGADGYYSFVYRKKSDSGIVYTNNSAINITGQYYGKSTDKSFQFRITSKTTEESAVLLKDSVNYFYPYYSYKYNSNEWWNGCIYMPYKLELSYTYDSKEKTYSYTIGTQPEDVKLSAIPENFFVYTDPAEPSTGKRSVHVKFSTGFIPDPECDYIITYNNGSSTNYYTDSLDFEVITGYKYYANLIVKDKNGNSYKSTLSKTIDATQDNISPSMYMLTSNVPSNVFEPSKVRLIGNLRILDNGQVQSGLFKDNGLIPFTYFVVKNQNNAAATINLSLEELYANYTPKKVYFGSISERSDKNYEENGAFMDFYFDEQDEGYYTVFVEAKDNSPLHNTSVTSFYINNTTMKKSLEPDFTYDSSGNILIDIVKTLDKNKVNGIWPTFYLAGLRETDNNWIRNQGPRTDSTTWTVDSTYNGSFLKCSGRCSRGLYDVTYYSTVNFDPENPVTCENKNLMKCETGYQVFADSGKPVFIHTMVSKYNYGTNKQDWYNKAIETNLKVKKSGGNFSYHPDFSHYPEDYWMTVIAHFADDDAVMSYPMQIKNYR